MFGLEYIPAIMKVLFNVAFAIVTAIPFWISWNCIAPTYLSFIPEIYQQLPYWHVVAAFLVCGYLGEQITKLVPSIVNISMRNGDK